MISTTMRATCATLLLGTSTIAIAQEVPIVLPGAPGQSSRVIDEAEATKLSDTRYSPADVKFMQDMIVHHQQAVEMAALVDERSSNEGVRKIADRIDASQADEIAFMRDWLTARGQSTGMQAAGMTHHAGMDHGSMDRGDMDHSAHHAMMGMATPAQMTALAAAEGDEFDRQFLTLMIRHHQGAIDMVRDLHRQPGSAYDPVMFEFTNDIVNDQETEIERMNVLLAGLSTDPRVGLAAGFRDAGEAISNLRLVAAMPKPTGFFDPANPAQLQPVIEDDEEEGEADAEADAEEPDAEGATDEPEEDGDDEDRFGQRSSLLSFANTDMAFSGDLLVAGSYHGFNAYRLGDDGMPSLVSSTVCPGGQGDVSIVGDLLFMSVQDSRARVDCGLGGVADRQRRAFPRPAYFRHLGHFSPGAGRPGADLPWQPHAFCGQRGRPPHRDLQFGHLLCPPERGTGGMLPGRGRRHRAVQHRRDRGAGCESGHLAGHLVGASLRR